MAASAQFDNDAQIEEILALIARITAGDLDTRASANKYNNGLNEIVTGLNKLAENLSVWDLPQVETEERLNSLLDAIIAISGLNFEHKAAVSESGDIFDAVAVGLNALGEELQASTVSQEFLDDILVSMVDSLIVLDQDAKIRMVNQALMDLLGYTQEELVGQPLEAVITDEEIKEYTPGILNKIAFIRDKETHFKSKYDLRIPVSYSLAILRDDEGFFNGAVCVGHDITAKLEDRAAMRESEVRYRTLFEQSPFGVLLTDPETTAFVEFNDSMAAMLGYSRSEFGDLKVADIEYIDSPEEIRQRVEKIFHEGQGEFETMHITKDGNILDVVANVQIIELEGKTVLLSIVRDITKSKRADEQIKASLAEKEVLLKEVHHRVKNNLQIISSLLYLQSKQTKDRQTLKILQDSRNRVKAMSLIHEKLYQSDDLAQIEFGAYTHSLVQTVFSSFGINPKIVSFEVNAEEVFLGVDLAIPCGVIINELVSNSLKHAFPDGREGKITINVHANSSGEWNLRVQDNGVGLSNEIDFKNTDSLGLQLVDNLVKQLGGSMQVHPNRGADFEIAFYEKETPEVI